MNKTPRPSLPSIHLESSWWLLLHWMRKDSAVTGEKNLQGSRAPVCMNDCTQAAKGQPWSSRTGAFLKRIVASFLKEKSTLDIPNLRGKEYL